MHDRQPPNPSATAIAIINAKLVELDVALEDRIDDLAERGVECVPPEIMDAQLRIARLFREVDRLRRELYHLDQLDDGPR